MVRFVHLFSPGILPRDILEAGDGRSEPNDLYILFEKLDDTSCSFQQWVTKKE